MTKRYTLGTAAAVGLLFVLACITVNIYFPEATVKQAAAEIVDEIRKTEGEKKAPEAAAALPARREAGPFTLVPAAFAQEATGVSTPAIRALKESMKARFPLLKPYFDAGQIGETNNGLLDVRDEAGLNLQAKAALRNAVRDENGDRTKLYAEVAKALNIEAGQVEKIQKIFAEEWAKSAAPGWWVQGADGAWAKK
ncbi:MAG: YdbL family protein [Acidobacteria bacterium]|nr:YdbL family protein [Acidobacteriota bacterium]